MMCSMVKLVVQVKLLPTPEQATTLEATLRMVNQAANHVRHRNRDLRRRLQARNTKSAKRLLKRRSRKESRFAADTNHVISNRIVTEAKRTGRGISGRPEWDPSWNFHQLGSFIAYKAARQGVPLVYVDPAYTSQECSSCGHVDKRNRPRQAAFSCTSCGFAEHADVNAARNITSRGAMGRAVSHAA